MLILIFFLIFGAIMAYLALNNSMLVALHLGSYVIPAVPLFYVIIGSFLTGLVLAYLVYLVNSIFTGFSMRRKDKTIKHGKSDIVDLTKQIHQLELENERLKNNFGMKEEPQDKNAL